MKTIGEAAEEYNRIIYKEVYEPGDLSEQKLQSLNDFKAGVEFAQRWISIEELPKSGETVLVKLSNNEHRLAFVNIYNQFIISMLNNYESESITHWRPIELI